MLCHFRALPRLPCDMRMALADAMVIDYRYCAFRSICFVARRYFLLLLLITLPAVALRSPPLPLRLPLYAIAF